MQKYKINKKAYIIIWTIFINIIILIAFTSINTTINKNLEKSKLEQEKIINYEEDELKNLETRILKNGDEVFFKNNEKLIKSFKKDEEYIINTNIQNDENIDIIFMTWNVFYYEVLAYTWATKSIYSTWIINSSQQITINYLNWLSDIKLYFKNLSWYSRLYLSGNTVLQWKENYYYILSNIWNKSFIKSSWIIEK